MSEGIGRRPDGLVRRLESIQHAVLFYESEDYLYGAVCCVLAAGLRAGKPILVIASSDRRRAFADRLMLAGCDPRAAIESGQFVQVDAGKMLADIMINEWPDRSRFIDAMDKCTQRLRSRDVAAPVLVVGELVEMLWREGRYDAAVQVEEFWDELAASNEFSVLCAYSTKLFDQGAHTPRLERICSRHTSVIPTEGYCELHETALLRELTLLQQRLLILRHAERAESFLSAVIDSADDAIVSKTLDGIVTTWNPGAEKLFGYSAEEMIGKPVAILIPPEQHDEEPRILAKLRRGEKIEHYETRRVRKNGEVIDISLTVSPIKDAFGKVIGASKIARDITDRKRIEAERDRLLQQEKDARSEAEAAGRVKDEFLAILSHELRTPLNAILGWSSILESRRDEEILRRAVDVIQRNAAMQKRLIDDLLDMGRILSGKMVIKSDSVDLVAVLTAALDSVAAAAAAKGIHLEHVFDARIRFIRGDADRLQQVLWNLLSNSIKFTPEDGRVRLQLQANDAHVHISIQDTGQGITPEFLPHVFDRFRQADGGSNRLHEGLGLGLAIVRHLVEAHGGNVWADSAGRGQGATFTVRLPALNQREQILNSAA